jgi:Ni,Fe-hydrogenase maturation factor
MIDAAEMGLAIGSVRWLEWEHLPGWTVSTRSYPLHTMASYLAQDIGSVVGVLGIQPDRVCLGAMTSKMSRRVSEIAQQLHDVLHSPMNDVDDEFHASLVPQRK